MKVEGGVAEHRGEALRAPLPGPGLIIAAALLVWTLSSVDQSLFSYALPGILAEFRRGPETAGMILSVSFLASVVLVALAGLAADRFGRVPVMLTLLCVSSLFVGSLAFADSIPVLTTLRAVGFGLSAGLSPVTNAMVMDAASPRRRGIAMGVLQCGYPAGWLIASLAAAPLLAAHGWRSACLVAFVVPPLALLLWFGLRGVPRTIAPAAAMSSAPSAGGGLRELLGPVHRRRFWASFATFFLIGGAYAGSAFFFPTFFTSARGYTAADAALLVGISNGVAVIGYLSAAAIGEFVLSRRTVFVTWCVLGAAALLTLLWVSSGRTADYVCFAVMAMFFYGGMAVLSALVAEVFPPALRGTALGSCASAPLSLGFVIFPLLVPWAVGHVGWTWALTGVVTPALIGAALAALFLPAIRPGASDAA